MNTFTRRDFLTTSLAGAGLATLAPQVLRAAEPATRLSGADIVELGKTGIKASRLAQGTGYNGFDHSSEQTRLGKDGFDRLLRHGLDHGISFIDMADLYGSHPFVKDVIKGMPRNKLALLTKLWPQNANWVTPSGGAKEEVDRFRKELGTDYLDVCLIHCMQNDTWPRQYARIRDELSELKRKGAVRAVGVSCHDLGDLEGRRGASVGRRDFRPRQLQVRPGVFLRRHGGASYRRLKTAKKNGKAVVGMKIFGAGKLTEPEQKDASLKFVLGGNLVDAITIGMLSTDQVTDTLKRVGQVKRA